MGKSQFDEPMTFAKWWAIRSSALLELKLTPAQWYEKFAGQNIDSGGTPQLMLDTSGRITEASAANNLPTISTYGDYISRAQQAAVPPTFENLSHPASAAVINNYHRRLFQTTLTATAGGEIVAADIGPPTLASYQGCMLLTHIYSDQTDASIALSITASSGGFTTGLGSLTIATVADTVSPDFNQGLAWLCDTDAATIQVSCAAGQAGNAQSITFCGVYWYET